MGFHRGNRCDPFIHHFVTNLSPISSGTVRNRVDGEWLQYSEISSIIRALLLYHTLGCLMVYKSRHFCSSVIGLM
jgi:hypothetical protein